jgi:hypothetical protein
MKKSEKNSLNTSNSNPKEIKWKASLWWLKNLRFSSNAKSLLELYGKSKTMFGQEEGGEIVKKLTLCKQFQCRVNPRRFVNLKRSLRLRK